MRFRFGHKSFYRFGIRSCLATSHKQLLKTPSAWCHRAFWLSRQLGHRPGPRFLKGSNRKSPIYGNKENFFHKKRVQFPHDLFGTPIWPPWRHVKTIYLRIHDKYRQGYFQFFFSFIVFSPVSLRPFIFLLTSFNFCQSCRSCAQVILRKLYWSYKQT